MLYIATLDIRMCALVEKYWKELVGRQGMERQLLQLKDISACKDTETHVSDISAQATCSLTVGAQTMQQSTDNAPDLQVSDSSKVRW
jgi:hypothetical protein